MFRKIQAILAGFFIGFILLTGYLIKQTSENLTTLFKQSLMNTFEGNYMATKITYGLANLTYLLNELAFLILFVVLLFFILEIYTYNIAKK